MFAIAAGIVATAGLYSMLTFLVTGPRREWAIRLAIGAAPRDPQRVVLGHAVTFAGAGAIVGAVLLAVIARPMSALVYAVTLWDLRVVIGTALVLSAVTVAAAVLPARRAAAISPTTSSRDDRTTAASRGRRCCEGIVRLTADTLECAVPH